MMTRFDNLAEFVQGDKISSFSGKTGPEIWSGL